MIDHGIHISGSDPEKIPGFPHFFKIPQIVSPVWLCYNGYLKTPGCCESSDDCRTKGGMIHVCITSDQDDVGLVPSQPLHFIAAGWQPVGKRPVILNRSHQSLYKSKDIQS